MDDIINHQEYQSYIKNNNKLSECHKRYIVYIQNTFNVIKMSPNMWMTTYYNVVKNDIQEKARFELLIKHFTKQSLHNLLKSSKDDAIIKYLRSNMQYDYQDKSLCKKWQYAVQSICQNIKIKGDIHYLDVGCGDAKKTKLFQQTLNIPIRNVFCTDIALWGPYSQDKSKLPFQFQLIENNKLKFKSKQFNILSCILTLHHVPNLLDFIKEIHRVLKKNGLFILIEHCVYTKYDKALIDIQHLLFGMLYDKREDYIEKSDYIQCFNKYQWNYIIENLGFQAITTQPLSYGNEFNVSYDNIYFTIYKKI